MKLNSAKNFLASFAQYFAILAVKIKSASIRIIFFFTIISFSHITFSQEIKLSETIISIAEQLAADEDNPEALNLYIERLHELAEDPVSLNSANESEIARIFFLSDFQIKAISDYVSTSGKIVSVYEIANIPGFDRETVEWMIPFISLETGNRIKDDSIHWHNNLITNISYKPKSQDPSFIGSPMKVLSKYRFIAGNFSGGITAEKDAGEKYFSGTPPAPDFFSCHLAYSGTGLIKKLIIGDYSARFGLGTNINSGIRTGTALTSPGFISSRNEIKPYTSSDENNYFRGASASLSYKFIDLTLFYSKNKTDATLIQSDTSSEFYIKTFLSGGYHNTIPLLNKKDNVTDETLGLNFAGNYKNLRLGFTWTEDSFSIPVQNDISTPDKAFNFAGTRNELYTLYYNGLVKRSLLFGEISVNDYKNYALLQGLSLRPSDRLSMNFLYRRYSPGFFTVHGKGPGQGSETKNEQGIAAAFSFEAAKHLFISGGCDAQRYDWFRYRCTAPSRGIRKELRLRYEASPSLTFDALYFYRMAMADNGETSGIKTQSEIITRSGRFSFRYLVNKNLTLASRFDYKFVQTSGSTGVMIFQDINYSFRKIPLSLWYRYCLYTTDDWDSRLYAYENDLLYSFSIPALSGKGSRNYIMVKWDIGDLAEFRIKYAITSTAETNTPFINSDEIRFQLKVLF